MATAAAAAATRCLECRLPLLAPATPATLLCCPQDQVDELDALRACYDDLLQLAPAETDNLRFASAVAAGGSAAAAPADVPALSGTLQLPDVRLGGAPVLLKFVLGRGAAPSLTVLANASRSDADSLQQLASSVAAEAAADGAPCLLTAADRLAAAAAELAAAEAAAEEERQRAGEQQPAAGSQQQQQQAAAAVLARRAVWYHHIYSEAKKRAIVALARELGIGGMCKPGAPGVLLIEASCGGLPCRACRRTLL